MEERCDANDHFVGVIGDTDWNAAIHSYHAPKSIADIVNRNCTTITGEHAYEQARNIYACKDFEYLPVIDSDGNFIDLFSRRRAFYKDYLMRGELPRMPYARLVWDAARLPQNDVNYLDMSFIWQSGFYKMDFDRLENKLDGTKLILGDIKETSAEFYKKYAPAPVGAVMIDVDLYTSTISALQLLDADYENVLPRVFMYFDDIMKGYECVGENIAIKNFNRQNESRICISPEGTERPLYPVYGCGSTWEYLPYDSNCKICHYFEHPKYKKFASRTKNCLPLTMLDL